MQGKDCKGSQPLLLLGAECRVKRSPRVRKFLQILSSLSQGVRPSVQERNGIAVAQDIVSAFVTHFAHRLCYPREAGITVLRPDADGVCDGWPVFLLVRCQ